VLAMLTPQQQQRMELVQHAQVRAAFSSRLDLEQRMLGQVPNLTPDQTAQLQQILASARSQMATILRSGDFAAGKRVLAQTHAQIGSALSAEQNKRWAEAWNSEVSKP